MAMATIGVTLGGCGNNRLNAARQTKIIAKMVDFSFMISFLSSPKLSNISMLLKPSSALT